MPHQSQIHEHMEVVASDGQHVGRVDHMEGNDQIKLVRRDDGNAAGEHHFIPISWVDHVDEHVHLSKSTKEVVHNWRAGA